MIYVVAHKYYDMILPDGYCTICVGKDAEKLSKFLPSSIVDSVGDNISDKNDSYCELTALYWIWKNSTEEYVGLCHYRRFFAHIKGIRFNSRYYTNSIADSFSLFSEDELKKKMRNTDIIIKISEKYKRRNNMDLMCDDKSTTVPEKDWKKLEELIWTDYPEYYDSYKKYSKDRRHFNCNMFYCKKSLITGYCEWLFSILDILDQQHIMETGKRYQNREMGYYAEFLFGVWIKANHLRVKIIEAVSTDRNNENSVHYLRELPGSVKRFLCS